MFGIATAFAPSLVWFYLFRICVGMCTSFVYTLGLLMSIELTGTKTRALMSVICSIGYTCSVFVLLAIAYHIRTWRGLALASSTPLLILFALWKFFPESPRYASWNHSVDWLIVWLIVRSIDWLIDWLIVWLIDLIDCLFVWSID